MKLHKLLSRQLGKLKLNEHNPPETINDWERLLDTINKTYEENDQERYLLERSMEISSRELMELNHKLENAQQIAHLGYWFHDVATKRNIWSKELYKMFKLDFADPVPDIKKILQLTHEHERSYHKSAIDRAFSLGEDYTIEIRMKHLSADEEYNWYHVIGQPVKNQQGEIHQIMGVIMDISNRKKIEEEVISLHQQLLSSARRAGMADVATSILHNVGNTLNSANVSIGLIQENVNEPYFKKLFAIQQLLNEHQLDLTEFIVNDPKGKLVLPYLKEVLKKIKKIHANLTQEVYGLKQHIEHIKDVSAIQKLASGMSPLIEKAFLPELIENAIQMSGDFEKLGIKLVKEYQQEPTITTDKSKILQILINLLLNAKDSLLGKIDHSNDAIFISIKKKTDSLLQIDIKDNGIGIDKKNLNKIFSLGFTTKQTGHGYGLHSSALAAKQLGGELQVKSPGINHGATFSITLPLQMPIRRNKDETEKAIADYHY